MYQKDKKRTIVPEKQKENNLKVAIFKKNKNKRYEKLEKLS